jgi:hypothetical protein
MNPYHLIDFGLWRTSKYLVSSAPIRTDVDLRACSKFDTIIPTVACTLEVIIRKASKIVIVVQQFEILAAAISPDVKLVRASPHLNHLLWPRAGPQERLNASVHMASWKNTSDLFVRLRSSPLLCSIWPEALIKRGIHNILGFFLGVPLL